MDIYIVAVVSVLIGWWLRGAMEHNHRRNLWHTAREIAVQYPKNGETQRALYELAKYF